MRSALRGIAMITQESHAAYRGTASRDCMLFCVFCRTEVNEKTVRPRTFSPGNNRSQLIADMGHVVTRSIIGPRRVQTNTNRFFFKFDRVVIETLSLTFHSPGASAPGLSPWRMRGMWVDASQIIQGRVHWRLCLFPGAGQGRGPDAF